METAEKTIATEETDIMDDLKNQYWNLLAGFKYHEAFLRHYNKHLKLAINIVVGFSTISTGGMVITWIVAERLINILALVVTAAQVLQAVLPYTVYHSKSVAISFYLPKLQNMVLAMEQEWNEIDVLGKYNCEQLTEIISYRRKKHSDMELEYLNGFEFPDRKSICRAAKKECDEFFFRLYKAEPGKEMNL